MIGSPRSQQWLAAWKTRAQNQRQWLANALAQKPATPTQAWRRQLLLAKAQTSVDNRGNWAEAYHQHLKDLAQILSTSPSKVETASKASSGSKGSLSD